MADLVVILINSMTFMCFAVYTMRLMMRIDSDARKSQQELMGIRSQIPPVTDVRGMMHEWENWGHDLLAQLRDLQDDLTENNAIDRPHELPLPPRQFLRSYAQQLEEKSGWDQ